MRRDGASVRMSFFRALVRHLAGIGLASAGPWTFALA
jgi:hypothetical protein